MKIIAASRKVYMKLLLPLQGTGIELFFWDCIKPEYKHLYVKKQAILDGEAITYYELDTEAI